MNTFHLEDLLKFGLKSCLRKIRNFGIDEEYGILIKILEATHKETTVILNKEDRDKIKERIYKTFCLLPGKERIIAFEKYLLEYIEINYSTEEKVFTYPYLSSLLPQTHSFSDLNEFIKTNKNINFLLLLILELAVSGHTNDFDSNIIDFYNNHNKTNPFLGYFSLDSFEFESSIPTPLYHWDENLLVTDKIEKEQIFGGIKKITFKTYAMDNQLHKLKESFPFLKSPLNKIELIKCISNKKIDVFSVWENLNSDFSEDKDDIYFYKIDLENLYKTFFQLSAYSGNQFTGWFGGLGRLYAWYALHTFVLEDEFINPYQSIYLLKQYNYLFFETGSDWFYGKENDFGLIANSPDETNMKILAISIW